MLTAEECNASGIAPTAYLQRRQTADASRSEVVDRFCEACQLIYGRMSFTWLQTATVQASLSDSSSSMFICYCVY